MKKQVERTICDFCEREAGTMCDKCKRDACYAHGGTYSRTGAGSLLLWANEQENPRATLCDECARELFATIGAQP